MLRPSTEHTMSTCDVMPVKRLHVNSKIFFSNPTVIRVEYDCNKMSDVEIRAAHRKQCRDTFNIIRGTWGHSHLLCEHKQVHSTDEIVRRSYFCFRDDSDALQFRLAAILPTFNVKLWPKILFTIHELDDILADI